MRCRRARHLIAARLDGHLARAEITELEEHLATCSTCRAEWQRMNGLDKLFRSASMMPAPAHLPAQVMARIDRREQARRAIVGSLALALGATAVTLLTLAPVALRLLENLGIAPALLIGGVGTATQVVGLIEALSRTLLILLGQFAIPLAVVATGSLTMALALNGLWIATVRKLRLTR